MDLPNELILQSIGNLDRSDLKSARLVSRDWSLYSSEYLFDTIYASTQNEDLTVFKAIAQHPILSKCVRTLEYDTATFDTSLSLSAYVERLWCQLDWVELPDHVDDSDPDVNKFVQLLQERPRNRRRRMFYEADAQRLLLGMRFVQEGYADWKRRAEEEMELKADNRFSNDLVQGLSNLTRLQSVRLNGAWFITDTELSFSPSLPKVDYGSPLARQWNIFQAIPMSWHRQPNNTAQGCRRDMPDLYGVASALAVAGKRPRKFECGPTMPPTVFLLPENPEVASAWLSCLGCYTNIHRLELDLDSNNSELVHDKDYIREQGNLKGLQCLLGNAKHLQHLSLSLPRDYSNIPLRARLFRYDHVFPTRIHWPKLVFFSLQNLSLHMEDFVGLFDVESMISLKTLKLGNIELLSGTWEAAIEILKFWPLDLDALCIDQHSFLWHGSPQRRQFVTSESRGLCELAKEEEE